MADERKRWTFFAVMGALALYGALFAVVIIAGEMFGLPKNLGNWTCGILAVLSLLVGCASYAHFEEHRMVYRWPLFLGVISFSLYFLPVWFGTMFAMTYKNLHPPSQIEILARAVWTFGQLAFSIHGLAIFTPQLAIFVMLLAYFLAGRSLSLR